MNIAIDVGGTKISAALVDGLTVLERKKMPSVIHTDLSHLAEHLHTLCADWIRQADQVAIACTGLVGNSHVNFLSAGQSIPLKQALEDLMHLPVHILNDAAAAAWAEYCAISDVLSEPPETLVYITISTGIGGGVIQNGQLICSNDGFCAHLGHMSVQAHGNDIRCHCGRLNCAEAIASGTAIANQASEILNKAVSCEEVFKQHSADPEIAKLIDRAAEAICDLIANVKAISGASYVVIGGSVGSATQLFDQIKNKVSQLPAVYQLTILKPHYGADADLIGATLYAKQKQDL
ncbi:ROK family protein (plasmid) [Alteromonas macleodii]|jgi:N-acylmannosamine kinase|tara:strand:+ start:503 stop:1378 length:876 start_codon:yes stop_codon:yes gene_type:complete